MPELIESKDVIYVHSPITYSIGRYLLQQNILKDPLVICGRKIKWIDIPHIDVIDDGIWDIDRVCDLLVKLCDELDINGECRLNMYLPHTGFLLGKLLKIAGIVQKIYYIEEGDSAYNPLLSQITRNVLVDLPLLISKLNSFNLIERLQINETDLLAINTMNVCWFDGMHTKYSGAYCTSPEAFPELSQVSIVNFPRINIFPEDKKIWVCMLPIFVYLIEKHQHDRVLLEKMLYGALIMLRTFKTVCDHSGASLVIKFHPVDELSLDISFKKIIYQYGQPYYDLFEKEQLDMGYEPALYNFDQFIVIDTSSASRYIKQFCGEKKLISIKL